ncbi:MAG: FlgD immunoglobulin-like domain containing protein [Bacteroidales bacterium]|nr:FlgD immunoglobulin-like domain containing protein [Bacteroidales bacterium]
MYSINGNNAMKNILIILVLTVIVFSGSTAFSQDLPYQKGLEPVSLTPDELYVLSKIPELQLPETYKGVNAPLLPTSVDNSTQPFFRPITWQSGYECGQSAGTAFNFTYEIDRVRGLAANVAANQYPTHFTWNFLNNANNYQGASFFDSWEINKACGNMNVADYGGALNTGGYTRWISGYNVYYNGMQNRINSVKAIRVDTPEGLQTLKYWLLDHLEGAAVGGVANIYAQYFGTPSTTLPANTPEAGKYVQAYWGGSPSHAWTICGYNDSIRYDFNNDGQYTNNIDINNDGVVDMRDWEKGGLKFANGYAGLPWCNSGFCYTMYKNLADNIGFGGIWNHTVYVIDVKNTCSPKLTMKVTLKHTSRNKLKVTAGVSTDLGATLPSYVLEFPIFNNQGGDLYMQGGTTEADKTIEFGLDLAPLVNQITSNQPAKYFLQVQETDPSGAAAGEIVNWSLLDYTGTSPVVTNYSGSNVPILNNTTTRLNLNYTLNIAKPYITNNTLPPAPLYQPYNVTLTANGGTPPYLWDAKLDYPETNSTAAFPAVTAQQLTLTNNNTGYAIKPLGFNFPFYKKNINKVYVYADGYILFDDQPFTWPYLIDKMLLFKQTAIIAPFMTDLTVYPASAQGVWYEGNASYAIFRWKASLNGMQGSTNLNFAVKIFPNGTIEYYYGDMIYPAGTSWTGGISSGDNKNFQFSTFHNGPAIAPNTLDKFTTCGFPPEMQITEDGHFTGTPTYSYQNLPVKFQVTDNDNISSTKVLMFSSYGLLINQTILSGGDSLIEFGELAKITLNINNIGSQTLNQLTFSITESDPYITLIDSVETVATITGGQAMTLTDAMSFQVAPKVPDNHTFTLILHVQSQEQSFQRPLTLIAHAPVFRITGTQFADGDNGRPEPGESADLLVTFKNAGSAKASAIGILLSSLDTNLTLNINSANINLLKPDSSRTLTFHATAGNSVSFEHLYMIKSDLSANNNYTNADTLYLFSGEIVEDFETGNFLKFPWYSGGQAQWLIESGVKYEGNYSARSGWLGDSQESKLNMNVNVLTAGPISFYKYVSCEHDPSGNKDYDYLVFLIDNFEIARWDGIIPWSKETFEVPEGYHTLSWIYHKDYSVAAGWDGCLLDFIKLPLIEGAVPVLSVTPLSIVKILPPGQNETESVYVTNLGGGILNYAALVFDTVANKKDIQTDNLEGSKVTCGSEGFVPGQAINWVFTVHNLSSDNEYIKHIRLDFPPGVVVGSATNFTGGSLGEFTFQGTTGNGASLNWHGESTGGRGALKPGETAMASVTGTIGEPFVNDVFVVYQLLGDNLGAMPHALPGYVKIKNYGLANTWVTLTNPTGSLMHNQTGVISVDISAAGMVSGTYHCSLAVRDLYNNKVLIPVTLYVPFPVDLNDAKVFSGTTLKGVFPNPFSGETQIRYDLSSTLDVTIEIYSLQGLKLRSWKQTAMQPGTHSLVWDGKDEHGHQVPAGVYTCRMIAGDYLGAVKMIVIR